MHSKYLSVIFVFALFLIPGVMMQYANAETDELTNDELHQLILDLTERVDSLEGELEEAQDTIVSLEEEIDDLENVSSEDEEEGDEDGDENDDEYIEGDGTGHIVLCHKDKNTIRVGVSALRAHIGHGDESGACDNDRRHGNWYNGDDDDDDDEDDEGEEEDEEEDEGEDA